MPLPNARAVKEKIGSIRAPPPTAFFCAITQFHSRSATERRRDPGGNCYFEFPFAVDHVPVTVRHRPIMQVLIRKAGTALYWNAAGRWTHRREQASDLREVCRAVMLCLHRGWTDAELVIRFEQTSGEMTVPVASLPRRRIAWHNRQSRRQNLCRRLSRLASILPFRRRRLITYGCRRNIGPRGFGRR